MGINLSEDRLGRVSKMVRKVETTIIWQMNDLYITEEDIEAEIEMFEKANPVQIIEIKHREISDKK